MSAPSASTPRRRWLFWLLLPTVALSAVAWFDDADTPVDEGRVKRARRAPVNAGPVAPPVAEASAASRLAQAVERLELPSLAKAEKSAPVDPADAGASAPVKLLAASSWFVAPPPPPPEAPKAPALPFKVLGRIIEGDAPAVFLAHQNRNLIAREGEQLDSTYLVERIEKNRMTLIYLPLAERQYLTLGAVN
jgi:hypothetical protein